MSGRRPRILVGRLYHESHTFLDGRTGLEGFEIRLGGDVLEAKGDQSPLDAILTTGRSLGWDVIPVADIFGMPGAVARDEVLDTFLEALRDAVARSPAIDGVCRLGNFPYRKLKQRPKP